MPFTFSHPAIILPLASFRKWFSLTGLVIGSLTPDFQYFIQMKMQGHFSHTLVGLFCFDLPLGVLLAFVFHNIIRNPFIFNLPKPLKSRLHTFSGFEWSNYFKRHWPKVIFSVLIGAASHLFWDSFTHYDGYFVNLIPSLGSEVQVFNFEIPVYKFLQHASTVAGGLVICFAILNLPVDKNPSGVASKFYWKNVILITLIIMVIRALAGIDLHRYGDIIASVITSFLIALILSSLSPDRLIGTEIFRKLLRLLRGN